MTSPEPNPYQAPGSDVSGAAVAVDAHLEPASRGRRFGTFVVDYLGYLLFCLVVGFLIGMAFGQQGVEAIQQVPEIVFGSVLFLVYYVFFEALWGRTPGKWLFGTRVVDQAGGPASLGQVVGRTLCRFIPFEAFSFFGKRGWHDSIPKTRVVRAH